MEVTMDLILSVFKNKSDSKRLREIKTLVKERLASGSEELPIFNNEQIADIEKQVENLIKEDKKLGNESILKYLDKGKDKGKYTQRPSKTPPPPGLPPSIYAGTAGEIAVMSELMFRGYNVNRMLIDEGVDIIAVKNNTYFYIQVKTTYIKDDGRIYCQISDDRYDQYIQSQMRYIIVVRYKDKKDEERNMFFVFNNQDIEKGIYERTIKRGQNCISIKIKFSEQSGEPYLYDERESNISYHLNRFKLS